MASHGLERSSLSEPIHHFPICSLLLSFPGSASPAHEVQQLFSALTTHLTLPGVTTGILGAMGHSSALQVFLSQHPEQTASLSPAPLCWGSFKLLGLKSTTSSEWPSLSLKILGTIYTLEELTDINVMACNVLRALCRAHTVNAACTVKSACPPPSLGHPLSIFPEEDPAGSVGGCGVQNPTSGGHGGLYQAV